MNTAFFNVADFLKIGIMALLFVMLIKFVASRFSTQNQPA